MANYDEEKLRKRVEEDASATLPGRIYFIFDQIDNESVNVRILDSTSGEDSDYVHVMCAGLQSILFEETDYVVDTGHSVLLGELYQENKEKPTQGKSGLEGNNIILFNKNKLN